MRKLLLLHMTNDCQPAELACLSKVANDAQYSPVVISCETNLAELGAAFKGNTAFNVVYVCAHGGDQGISTCVSGCKGITWQTFGKLLCENEVLSNRGALILGCCTGSAGFTSASDYLRHACPSLTDIWGPCRSITSEQTCIALSTILRSANDSTDATSKKLEAFGICMRKAA